MHSTPLLRDSSRPRAMTAASQSRQTWLGTYTDKQMQCIPDCLLKQTNTQNGQLTCSGNCCQHWLFHSSSHPRGPAHALCCSFHHLPGYSENSPSGSPRSQTCRPGHKPKRWGVEAGETPSTSSLEMSTREYVTVSNLVIYPASTNTNTNTDRHRHTNTETRFDLIFYYFDFFISRNQHQGIC